MGKGLLSSVEPGFANQPASQLAPGLWKWGPRAKKDLADVGAGVVGEASVPRRAAAPLEAVPTGCPSCQARLWPRRPMAS